MTAVFVMEDNMTQSITSDLIDIGKLVDELRVNKNDDSKDVDLSLTSKIFIIVFDVYYIF